ncbi:MAG TPA: hypothetical protein VEA69_20910 [Tepidisphaeraceae bacterium]|nr:hypothetical protein [Tepidisphaeraceae bacterium]
MPLIVALAVPSVAHAGPYASGVYAHHQGPATVSAESTPGNVIIYDDPTKALGAPDASAGPTVPSTQVFQLGQRGFVTLTFDEPVWNKLPGQIATNPAGADFVVFGNAFELGFVGSGSFFREPGFVEVAQKNPDGTPGPFYLLLSPYKAPAALVGGSDDVVGDSGPMGGVYDGYADVHPVNGAGDPLIAPDQPGSAGGDGFFLEWAVVQSSPGVPALVGGLPQFVALDHADFVRITDAIETDGATQLGGYTTDIDAVVNLPAVPEPGAWGLVVIGVTVTMRRRARGR